MRWVLVFLHGLFNQGLSYSTINTARSAISNIAFQDEKQGLPIGQHPLVCRYLKGVFNKIKPVPKYNNIWPVDTALDYLSLLWPLDKITLKELTMKLVLLISLTTGQRCQTLTLLDISEGYMQKDNNCFNFGLTEHLKQDRPGKVFGNLRLFKYTAEELCVYRTLEAYLEITAKLRSSSKLLVSYVKPHNAVGSSTISRWIKSTLTLAGIDTQTFSAHSTRCAATSKACGSVPTDVILATAGWNEESTFRKFYDKPVAVTNQMSVAVLE